MLKQLKLNLIKHFHVHFIQRSQKVTSFLYRSGIGFKQNFISSVFTEDDDQLKFTVTHKNSQNITIFDKL